VGGGRKCLVDGDQRRLRFDVDPGQASSAAGGIAAAGNHRKNHLTMKFDVRVREHWIVALDGADVVLAWDVGGRQHRDNAGRGTYAGQIHARDPAPSNRRSANRQVKGAGRFAQVVHIGRAAIDVPGRGVVPVRGTNHPRRDGSGRAVNRPHRRSPSRRQDG
jgi:hypothetical protein